MAQESREYRKLPGSKKGFLIGKYTLWEGPDHLLQILSRVGVEEYKRYYFSDIQAVITRKTISGALQNTVLAVLALIFVFPAIYFNGGWSLFYALAAAGMAILLLIGLFRGPTCETKLMTAVQTEKLHSLHRLKNTSKVMDRLRDHIHRSQGVLKRGALDKLPTRPFNKPNHSRSEPMRPPTKIAHRNEKGRAHMGLFLLLLLEGIMVSLGFFVTHVSLTIISSIAGLYMGIFAIVALVKQHDSNIGASLKAITWACLGFICINFVVGYVASFAFAMKNPGAAYNQWEMFKSMSLLSPWDSPLKMSFDIFSICGALFLGIPGLIMLYRPDSERKARATATAAKLRQPAVQRNAARG